MRAMAASTYNGGMETTHASPAPSAPHFAVAGTFLEALAGHDFEGLATALDPDASLSALLPRGFCEWQGASEICARFETWFGDVDQFEVVDASVGLVGALLQLRWRLRLQGARLGEEPKVVEQHAYAAAGPNGRIHHLSLLCSGFWPEHPDA
jgi:hypothetical protein